VILFGVTAQRKDPASAFGVCRVFLFLDKRFEISNLFNDIIELIKLSDTLSISSEMAE